VLQINGWGGVDFSQTSLTLETATQAFDDIIASGTAYFLPTVITSSIATYEHVLPLLATLSETPKYKRHVLGFHLEGPFISAQPGACGCHSPANIRAPDIELLHKLFALTANKMKILTIAAESPGAPELTKAAVKLGIVVSVGHHMATIADIQKCVEAGASMITHLGNGVPNSVNRHANPIIAGLATDELNAGIITDGFHLPPPLIKIMLRAKGVERLYITSDAASAAGLPPGVHKWMGTTVVVEQHPQGIKIRSGELNCLAGSGATMLQCVNFLQSLGFVSAAELEQLSFHNPLRFIGMTASDLEAVEQVLWVDAAGVFAATDGSGIFAAQCVPILKKAKTDNGAD
jgi:N-acetylglucosamine-6-phosphate deacetylase